ncbi:polyprenyl synthetase family protein [Thalassiella azotivora]
MTAAARGAVWDVPTTDPDLAERVATRLEVVEGRLREAVSHADELADSVSRHLVEAGGKRVRPLLTVLAAELGDPGRPEVLDAAVVVELTHLATLYHDDVMDSAPTRRGAPAAHAVWGNNVAILTGDLLFARASRIVAGLGPQAVRIQASTFERLCLGQLHETVGPAEGDDPVRHYVQVLADKTGSLIATSGRFGAMFAGCRDDVVDVMIRYGEQVGVAFQLADDVLDLASGSEQSGKTPGTDLREGVPTLPVLLARQAAAEGDAGARDVVRLLDGDLTDDAALADAVAALVEHPATARARSEARRWADDAVATLEPLPEGPAKEALTAFAQSVADRTA